MWSFQVVGAVNGERREVRREKVETNKILLWTSSGPGQSRVWNLPLGKEMAGLMDGGKERRERSGRAVGTGLDWGLGESKSGEGREGYLLGSHHKQFGTLTSEMCLISY